MNNANQKVTVKYKALTIVLSIIFVVEVLVSSAALLLQPEKTNERKFSASFKRPKLEDISLNLTGTLYVEGQALLTSDPDADYNDIEQLVNENDGEIVGYISMSNDYQIEFYKIVSEKQLLGKIKKLTDDKKVYSCTEHYVINAPSPNKETIIPDEPDDNNTQKNWWENAVRTNSVWDSYNGNQKNYTTVKAGIIDSGFDKRNTNLEGRFAKLWNEPEDYDNYFESDTASQMGTVNAGLISGNYDSQSLTRGAAPAASLYGYGLESSKTADKNTDEPASNYSFIFEMKYAIAVMLNEGVRVINISSENNLESAVASITDTAAFATALSIDEKTAGEIIQNSQKNISLCSDIMSQYLSAAVDAKYDFLIVTSAGSSSGQKIMLESADNKTVRLKTPADDVQIPFYKVNVSSAECGIFSSISDKKLKSRIIVAGGAMYKDDESANAGTYVCSEFSGVGKRTDIFAPATDILGCGTKNTIMPVSTTCAASAIITGICSDVWSINSSLTADKVKEIVCKSNTMSNPDFDYSAVIPGSDVPVCDALTAVNFAIDNKNSSKVNKTDDKKVEPYTWAVEPAIEADDIIVPNNVNQYSESYNYSIASDRDKAAIIDKNGELSFIGYDGSILGGNGNTFDYNYSSEKLTIVDNSDNDNIRYSSLDDNNAITDKLYMGQFFDTVYCINTADNKLYFSSTTSALFELAAADITVPVITNELARDDYGTLDYKHYDPSDYALYSNGEIITGYVYKDCFTIHTAPTEWSNDDFRLICMENDNDKWEYYNNKGEKLIAGEFDAACAINKFGTNDGTTTPYLESEGYIGVENEGEAGYYDTDGNVIVKLGEFEAARPVYNGKAWVKKDGKWGIIEMNPDYVPEKTEKPEEDETYAEPEQVQPQVAADSEEALRSKVEATTSDNIFGFYYADYDGDSDYEAYAVLTRLDDWNNPVIVNIIFVTADNTIFMDYSTAGYIYHGNLSKPVDGHYFFYYETGGGASASRSSVFGVLNGEPHELDISNNVEQFEVDDEGPCVHNSEFGEQGGHYWPRKALVYDSSTDQFSYE